VCYPEAREGFGAAFRVLVNAKRMKKLAGMSQLSPRFAGKRFDTFRAENPDQRRALAVCRKYADKWPQVSKHGTWIALIGGCGTGKGHLAAAIANEVMEKHLATVLFIKFYELACQIRDSWARGAEEREAEILEKVRKVDLLILDEIGVQFDTDAERRILYSVVDWRYEYKRPTIFTTNLDLEELERLAGERIVDRLYDHESGNRVIVFNWDSYRRKPPGKNKAGGE